MDTARLAEMTDPTRNPLFNRRWTRPPPQQRPGPSHKPRPPSEILNLNLTISTTAARAGERSIAAARRAAKAIERRAEILAAIGMREAALRAAAVAQEIRSRVLA